MPEIATKLANRLKQPYSKRRIRLYDQAEKVDLLEKLRVGLMEVVRGIGTDGDPLHRVYVVAQNQTSYFAEIVSQLPEFAEYCEIVGSAEDEYLPDAPPISPLTKSYFTTWAFFDCRFGRDKETIGTCLVEVGEYLGLSPEKIEVVRLLQNSRMGIYEHCGMKGSKVVLKELVGEEEHLCHATSGYLGAKGEIWYVRIVPPINESFDYSVVFTSPYVFLKATKKQWLAFMDRTLPKMNEPGQKKALHALMKYGLEPNYWNEFIFQAYYNHRVDVIFLAGYPDIKASRPHPY